MMVGSEAEIVKAEGFVCDDNNDDGNGDSDGADNTVFVAVSKNIKEGRSLLSWAVKSFPESKICLLHVHQPTHLVSLMDGKMMASKLKQQALKVFQELERQKMHKLLDQYLAFVMEEQRQADKVWIEMTNVQEGIIKFIAEHGVRRLVMGAAAEKYYSKKLAEVKSTKASFVCQQAPDSCHIWFVCKGCLIHTRLANTRLDSSSIRTSSSTNSRGKTLLQNFAQDGYEDASNLQLLEPSTWPIGQSNGASDATTLMIAEMRGNSLPSYSLEKQREQLPRSLSLTVKDNGFEEKSTGDVHRKLEQAVINAENSKQKAFEESLRRWKAEEDAMDTIRKAKASEDICIEETNQRKELEGFLSAQRQELERMNNHCNQFLKELQMIQAQRPVLESRLTESCCVEKEFEEKFFQAMKLLINFKEKRDELKRECDAAITEANRLRKLLKEDCSVQFFKFSFLSIVEATQNFEPSLKIHEGRSGTIYKANLRQTKVAIKMLPSCNFKNDQEFEYQVEVLSRVRHPHLVTLIGTCPESRSLIYEYLENGSLEDRLGSQTKVPTLPWQSRIRIAIDICSALVFLHASDDYSVHGNLKPTKILLGNNFISKIADLGSRLLISPSKTPLTDPMACSKNDFKNSIYIDPEYIENGELTAESDVYSYGIILLRLLTARPASDIVRDVTCALQSGNLSSILDLSAGNWPPEQATQLASLALSCCEKKRLNRPNLESEVWPVIQLMEDLSTQSSLNSTPACVDSKSQRRIPSHFVCPIFQEVMKDPYIAADGFTYEGDAIKGWLNSGHTTSPMTNLQLDHCELLPNFAIYYAIQQWQQQQS